MSKKNIVICADDFGINDSVSRAIVELAEKGRISATSCMTRSKQWKADAPLIKPHLGKIDLGLHFTVSGTPLPLLIAKSRFRLLNKSFIENELKTQLENFYQELGSEPDFIDGHQHIHQLPQISDTILKACKHSLKNTIYIRHVSFNKPYSTAPLKKAIISLASDRKFTRKLHPHNIQHNKSFNGIYHFNSKSNYRKKFLRFLKHCKNNEIIMCHPGLKDNSKLDPIATSRYCEYQYLISKQFVQDCEENNIIITRFQLNSNT